MNEPTNIKLDGEYQTRDGRAVRVLCVDAEFASSLSVVALIKDRDGFDTTASFCSDGYYMPSRSETMNDLIPAPKKHTNIYYAAHFRGKQGQATMSTYWSRESAVDCNRHNENLIAITGPHEIEFTEGDGLKGADDAQTED